MAEVSTNNQHDVQLDDDKQHQEGTFVGATLQIGNVAPGGEGAEVQFAGPGAGNFNRQERPGSVYGRQSVKSTSSRTSVRPGVIKPDKVSQSFFSYKVGYKACIYLV